ncbi:histone-lysine N-methyltransferase SETMAR [Trichonephila clavipes]|nr:histone-lysine N-methyltransferase SETMAR [Trichonephila clavipes]
MTPELAPPILTTTPRQREDVSALYIFNVYHCLTRRSFSGTGLELVTRLATIRHLYHSATAATGEESKLASKSFFFDKGENASQAEIAHVTYGVNTVTANYVQFWFRRFHSGIFDVKDVPRIGKPFVENVDKITEIIKVDRHISSCNFA